MRGNFKTQRRVGLDRVITYHVEFNAYHLTLVGAEIDRSDPDLNLIENSNVECNIPLRSSDQDGWLDANHHLVIVALQALDNALANLVTDEINPNILNGGLRP